MAEVDVESEIYERLYGMPRRERHNGGPVERPIVIVDGGIGAGTGTDAAHEGPARPSRVRRRQGAEVLAAALAAVVAAVVATARSVGKELRPAIDRSSAAVRRRPVEAGVLAAALIAVLLVVLLVSAGSSSRAARLRLAVPPPPQAALASAPPATPRTGPRRSSPQPTRTAAEASAGPAIAAGTDTAAIQRRPTKAHVLTRRTPTRREKRVAPRPRPAPIKQPTAHERPAHRPPTGTTPTTPPAGTGPTNVTGGQPAPPG